MHSSFDPDSKRYLILGYLTIPLGLVVTQGHGSSIFIPDAYGNAPKIQADRGGAFRLPTEVGSTWDNNFFPEAASSSLANRANASLQDNKM